VRVGPRPQSAATAAACDRIVLGAQGKFGLVDFGDAGQQRAAARPRATHEAFKNGGIMKASATPK
jgi:hypothetical protein